MKLTLLKNTFRKTFLYRKLERIVMKIWKSIIAMTTFSSFSQRSTMTTFFLLHPISKRCDGKSINIFLSFCYDFPATILVVITICILISHYLFSFALWIFFFLCRWGKSEREGDRSEVSERETNGNHARHYPTPKLLRLLCFMENAITFISFVVKIYLFSCF